MRLLGQNIIGDDNTVWITKTHFPMDTPNSRPFVGQKMIVMARNPIDVMPSFANLCNTGSHSLVPNEEYHTDFPEYWDEWVNSITQSLKKNHEQVLT